MALAPKLTNKFRLQDANGTVHIVHEYTGQIDVSSHDNPGPDWTGSRLRGRLRAIT